MTTGISNAQAVQTANIQNNPAQQNLDSVNHNGREIAQATHEPESQVQRGMLQQCFDGLSSVFSDIKQSFNSLIADIGESWSAMGDKLNGAGEAIKAGFNDLMDAIVSKFSSDNNSHGLDFVAPESHIRVDAFVDIQIDANVNGDAQVLGEMGIDPGGVDDAQVMEVRMQQQWQSHILSQATPGNILNDVDVMVEQINNQFGEDAEGKLEGIFDQQVQEIKGEDFDENVDHEGKIANDANIAQQAQAAFDLEMKLTDIGDQQAQDFADVPTDFAQQQGEVGEGANYINIDEIKEQQLAAQSKDKQQQFADDLEAVSGALDAQMQEVLREMEADMKPPKDTAANQKFGEL